MTDATEPFFAKWERDFKISMMFNEKTVIILKSSTYFPGFRLMKSYQTGKIKPGNTSGIGSNLPMNKRVNEELPLSLDKEYKGMDEQLTKWHIENCGLILVHPFLKHLFILLNYLGENNKFKNEELQERAIHLLHFIATGSSGPDN